MILTCPNCGMQYVVKDGAIPPQGRQVRCASCKHSWHQDPEPTAEDGENEETIAEATLIEPRSGPEAEERAYEDAIVDAEEGDAAPEAPEAELEPERREEAIAEYAAEQHAQAISADFDAANAEGAVAAAADWNEPPQAEAADDEFSPFPRPDEGEPRPRSPVMIFVVLVLAIAALAAAIYFLAPDELKARIGLGPAAASPLELVTTHMDRRQLESGNELLTVTGRVVNPTSKEQNVPALRAQLRSKAGKIVYSWTIPAPAPSLAAGASVPFNSAEVSVPSGGDELTITLDGSNS